MIYSKGFKSLFRMLLTLIKENVSFISLEVGVITHLSIFVVTRIIVYYHLEILLNNDCTFHQGCF